MTYIAIRLMGLVGLAYAIKLPKLARGEAAKVKVPTIVVPTPRIDDEPELIGAVN
jgi:hypothetical protein